MGRTTHEPRIVERIPPATHLHEEGVEARLRGQIHHPIDLGRRNERGPNDPQRPDLPRRRLGRGLRLRHDRSLGREGCTGWHWRLRPGPNRKATRTERDGPWEHARASESRQEPHADHHPRRCPTLGPRGRLIHFHEKGSWTVRLTQRGGR